MLFVGGHFQPSGVGLDDLGVFEAFLEVVYQDVVEHSRLPVLVLDVEVVAFYLVVEDAFGDVELG